MQTLLIVLSCLCCIGICLSVTTLCYVIKAIEELRVHHFQFWQVREYIGMNLPKKTQNRSSRSNASEE